MPDIVIESEPEDSVMKEIEDFVKPKRNNKNPVKKDDVYEMCD